MQGKNCLREADDGRIPLPVRTHSVVTIVGEGEPTLYASLGELLHYIKELVDKPVAVITNGSLLYDRQVQEELLEADIVLPSLDACNAEIFKKINRPLGFLNYNRIIEGIREFSRRYRGELWLETMLIKDLNDDRDSLVKLKQVLDGITYSRLYINTPVRAPVEKWVSVPNGDRIKMAVQMLGGIAIDSLAAGLFYSGDQDDLEALLSIIQRHPMNQHEIKSFLVSRHCENIEEVLNKLGRHEGIELISYRGYETYRLG